MAEVSDIALEFLSQSRHGTMVDVQQKTRTLCETMPEEGIGALAALRDYWESMATSTLVVPDHAISDLSPVEPRLRRLLVIGWFRCWTRMLLRNDIR